MKIYASAVLTNIVTIVYNNDVRRTNFLLITVVFDAKSAHGGVLRAYGFQLKRMYDYYTYGSYVQHPFEPQRKVSVCLTQGAAMQQYRQ